MDAYTQCRGRSEQLPLFIQPNGYGIVLCPGFFNHAAIPSDSSSLCLTVDPHFDRFSHDGRNLITYRIWLLLHELVAFYVQALEGEILDIQGVNGCETMLARDAVRNPWNFVFYVISELAFRTPIAMIVAGSGGLIFDCRYTAGLHRFSSKFRN